VEVILQAFSLDPVSASSRYRSSQLHTAASAVAFLSEVQASPSVSGGALSASGAAEAVPGPASPFRIPMAHVVHFSTGGRPPKPSCAFNVSKILLVTFALLLDSFLEVQVPDIEVLRAMTPRHLGKLLTGSTTTPMLAGDCH